MEDVIHFSYAMVFISTQFLIIYVSKLSPNGVNYTPFYRLEIHSCTFQQSVSMFHYVCVFTMFCVQLKVCI